MEDHKKKRREVLHRDHISHYEKQGFDIIHCISHDMHKSLCWSNHDCVRIHQSKWAVRLKSVGLYEPYYKRQGMITYSKAILSLGANKKLANILRGYHKQGYRFLIGRKLKKWDNYNCIQIQTNLWAIK